MNFSFAIEKDHKNNRLKCDDFVNDLTVRLDLRAFFALFQFSSTDLSTGSVDIAISASKRGELAVISQSRR